MPVALTLLFSHKMENQNEQQMEATMRRLSHALLGLGLLVIASSPWAKQPPEYVQLPSAQAASAAYDDSYSIFQPVIAQQAIIATEEQHATRAALEVWQDGGSVVDAAVTIGFTLAVTLPNDGNLRGGGFMVNHDANDNEDSALDCRETYPMGAHHDTFLDKQGERIDGRSLYSRYGLGVSGTVAGVFYAHEKWGQLPLQRFLATAIELAEEG